MCPLKTPDDFSVKELWKKLENYLEQHSPHILVDLNPPAPETEIANLEEDLGFSLPADFVTCLKLHNGQKGNADWLFDGEEFLSIKSIALKWRALRTVRERGDFDEFVPNSTQQVRHSWWLPKWVPFTSNGMGDFTCLDLDPGPHGTQGQIICFFHDLGDRNVLAPNFTSWFRDFVNLTVS